MFYQNPEFRLGSFFGVRTPLLPFTEWRAWNSGLSATSDQADPKQFAEAYDHDCRILRERLRALVARPEILEALQVASPDLVSSLSRWQQEPESEKGQRSERALVRYFARMCHRPTPFGLFAAHGMGRMGVKTQLEVAPRKVWWRHSRLDMGFLCDLVAQLQRDPGLRDHLEFRVNNSLYRMGMRLRYAKVQIKDGNPQTHLMDIQPDEPLEAVLSLAKAGSSLASLALSLAADDLPLEEARRYLDELVDQQVLVSDLELAPTGPDPLPGLIRTLGRSTSTLPASQALAKAAQLLNGLDGGGVGNGLKAYHALVGTLADLPAKVQCDRPWQVDLYMPASGVTLGPELQEYLLQAVARVRSLSPRLNNDPFKAFKESFRQRYDQRWVPLVAALDPESGVGCFGTNGNVPLAAPLLDGLAVTAGGIMQAVEPGFSPREIYLLRRLLEMRSVGVGTLELNDADCGALTDERPGDPLPHSFFFQVELSAPSLEALQAGEGKILCHSAWGPSAARMFGRFCQGDPALAEEVKRHLKEEEQLRPNAIFAEIAHLPGGRMGNVMARPVLRAFEIPFLGRSGAQPAQWIGLEDLYVGLVGDRVMLWSRQWNREIVPRLSSAAAYQDRGTDIYRFLASLQDQGVHGMLGFNWGSLAQEATLPRVVYDRLVLARAQWRWSNSEMNVVRKSKGAIGRFIAMQQLRRNRGLPRYLLLADSDNELPVDLDNALGIEALWSVIKHRDTALFLEDFPGGDQLVAIGPDGTFKHQLVLVLLAEPKQSEPVPTPPVLTEPQVIHAPGSDWLFAKLYMGQHTTETFLGGDLGKWIQMVLTSRDADRWFFIRYADPEPHLRLRFHGDPARIWGSLLPKLKQALDPFITSGSLWRFQLDSYQPETLRYGGLANQDRVERIFMADSEAALKILCCLNGENGNLARWQLAMASANEYYASADISVARRLEMVKAQCARFSQEFAPDDRSIQHIVGQRFRAERKTLATLLGPEAAPAGPLAQGQAILRARSGQLAPLFLEMKQLDALGVLTANQDSILESLIHMSMNRLLSSSQRTQEMVIYHLLTRWYESKVGRASKTAGPPA